MAVSLKRGSQRFFLSIVQKASLSLSLSRTPLALWFHDNLLPWLMWIWHLIILILLLEIHCMKPYRFSFKNFQTQCAYTCFEFSTSQCLLLFLFLSTGWHFIGFTSIVFVSFNVWYNLSNDYFLPSRNRNFNQMLLWK